MIRALAIVTACFIPHLARAAANEVEVSYRLTGLFQPDRVRDLSEQTRELDEFRLVRVSYEDAVATFAYDPDSPPFRDASEEQVRQRIDQQLRQASHGAFQVRPLSNLPRDQWREVRIEVRGLDCKGCSFGAYRAVFEQEGVQRVTASFPDGLVIVWIDPTKTNRENLVQALKKREVTIKGE